MVAAEGLQIQRGFLAAGAWRPTLSSLRPYLLGRFPRWGCAEALVYRQLAEAPAFKRARLPRRAIPEMMRVLLNGIFSARRLQLPARACLFGCEDGADELEHYFCCRRIVAALAALRIVHPESDWLAAWITGGAAMGTGPNCTSRAQTFAVLCMWLYEVHNDLRHNRDGASLNIQASLEAFFSEHAYGRKGRSRARRVPTSHPAVSVPPAQLESGLSALPALPNLVLVRRDGVNGAAGPLAQG